MLKIYNTLKGKKEDFVPLNGNKVNMYACGITVSGKAHVGHLFQALIYDIIRKYLKKSGYDVTYARNYTDIDDKIIINANKLGVDPKSFAEEKIKEIDDDMAYFQVGEPDLWMKATENVSNIIDFIEKLIEKGYAYKANNGDVYYSVEKFYDYGKLSNRNLKDALNGVRVENSEEKENPLDFALWKAAKPGEPYWDSPFGKGRPGWHIECSVMNHEAFGDQVDIHGGGRDLIFPHHENEIAQSEAYTGKEFVKYWTHNGLVKVNGQKMSKSLGNSILLCDLRKEQHPETVKLAMLQNSYHNDINLTDDLFKECEKHIYDFHKTIYVVEQKFTSTTAVNEKIDAEFNMCMDDDFNAAKAIANLYGYFKEIGKKLAANDDSALADVKAIKQTYSLLGLFVNPSKDVIAFIENKAKSDIPQEVSILAAKRAEAKSQKNWAEADALRAQITALGYAIKDSKDGYEIVKI